LLLPFSQQNAEGDIDPALGNNLTFTSGVKVYCLRFFSPPDQIFFPIFYPEMQVHDLSAYIVDTNNSSDLDKKPHSVEPSP
jgi:hypothetical protein